MWQILQTGLQSSASPECPHWRETIQMWQVWQSSVVLHSFRHTRELTQGRKLSAVRYVVRASVSQQIIQFIRESILVIYPITVIEVVKCQIFHTGRKFYKENVLENPVSCELCQSYLMEKNCFITSVFQQSSSCFNGPYTEENSWDRYSECFNLYPDLSWIIHGRETLERISFLR